MEALKHSGSTDVKIHPSVSEAKPFPSESAGPSPPPTPPLLLLAHTNLSLPAPKLVFFLPVLGSEGSDRQSTASHLGLKGKRDVLLHQRKWNLKKHPANLLSVGMETDLCVEGEGEVVPGWGSWCAYGRFQRLSK